MSDWNNVRAAVIGLGVSNLALARYLLKRGARVTGCDRLTQQQMDPARYRELIDLGIDLRLGEDYLDHVWDFDALFLTPGMVKDQPPIREARQRGRFIGSEIGLVLETCPATVIGITGSSGKSTTTALTGAMLSASGFSTYVGGNIGRPLIELAEQVEPDAVVVLELSSFQLELVDRSPRLAAVLNIAPNHLDVHPSLADYTAAKENVVRFQRPGDWAVLVRDGGPVSAMAQAAGGRVGWVDRDRGPGSFAWISDDHLVTTIEQQPNVICHRDEVGLSGEHNLINVLVAASLAALAGADAGSIRAAVSNFSSLPHRLERVAEIDGVTYVNDSIATAPDRTIAALRTFEGPVVLIAGGYDKKLPFDELGAEIGRRARALVLIGVTAGAIEHSVRSAGGDIPIVHAGSFDQAVAAARELAGPGDTVLLSPACASYDMFANFEQRGQRFREAVTSFVRTC